MTTTQKQSDWRDEQCIKQQEFVDGYAVEQDRRTPDSDGSDDALEYDQCEGNPNATTLYGGRPERGQYDPNAPLAGERWSTRRERAARLWALNAGVDSHRAPRRSREDCHKSDKSVKDRQRFVHAVASGLRIGDAATERARELATLPTPKALNFAGGLDAWVLAVALHAANEQRCIMRVDRDALHDERKRRGVTVDQLATATDMVADLAR